MFIEVSDIIILVQMIKGTALFDIVRNLYHLAICQVASQRDIGILPESLMYCNWYALSTGLVTELRDVHVTCVALGKAHALALTNKGHVYSFGINNKGQCGRDFIPQGNKEAAGEAVVLVGVIIIFAVISRLVKGV